MSYAKHKSKYILQNGVDFETFWRCMENFSNEKKEFATKLYNNFINKKYFNNKASKYLHHKTFQDIQIHLIHFLWK